MRITAIISNSAKEKLEALASRRYPNAEDAIDSVITDALQWKLNHWDRDGQSIRDWFWLKLAFYAPIPLLRAIAWGKLCEAYFDRVEK